MPTLETQATIPQIIIGKFKGMLSGFQLSALGELKLAGIKPEIAHKVCQDYGSDIGNAILNAGDEGLASKIAKAKKGGDGDSRISLSGGGSTKTSRAMSLIRLAQQLASLKKEGLITSCEIDEATLSENLRDYLTDCQEWCEKQTFAS